MNCNPSIRDRYAISCCSSPLMSSTWFDVKSLSSDVICFCSSSDDDFVCSINIVIKKIFNFKIGWASDGLRFTGNIKNFEFCLKSFLRRNKIYLLLSHYNNFFPSNFLSLRNIPLLSPLTVSKTFILDLNDLSVDDLKFCYNKTTRKYVNRAIKANLEPAVVSFEDLSDLYSLYYNLSITNSFNPVISYDDLCSLFKSVTSVESVNRLQIVSYLYRENGDVVSFIIVLVFGGRALEFLRADMDSIHSKYISRYLTHLALSECINRSVTFYDFGGVEDSNEGIFRFKESFGGDLVLGSGLRFLI